MNKQEVVMKFEKVNVIRLYADTVYDMLEPEEPYYGDIFTKKDELLQYHPECEVMEGYGLVEPETGIIISESDDWYDTIEDALVGILQLEHQEEVNTLYDIVTGYYDSYKPDDESFIEENEEISEMLDQLDSLYPTSFKEKVEALNLLTDFMNDWFPDCIDEDEQNEIQETLNQATAKYEELRKAFQEAKKLSESL